MRKKTFYIGMVALVLALIGTGYLGYLSRQLTRARDELTARLETEQQRFKHLQHKYAEQKALASAIQRAKLGVERQLVQARQDRDAMREEKETALREMAGMEKKYMQKTAHLEERIRKQILRVERLREIQAKYKTKLAEAVDVARERHTQIQRLEEENSDLIANLQETTSGLHRCEQHNVRLSELAEELVHAYEDKGVGASLAQAEPFTKIKQVEMEKLVQEYLGRIDKENMELLKPADEQR